MPESRPPYPVPGTVSALALAGSKSGQFADPLACLGPPTIPNAAHLPVLNKCLPGRKAAGSALGPQPGLVWGFALHQDYFERAGQLVLHRLVTHQLERVLR